MLSDTLPRKRAWTVALAATLTMTVSQLDRTTLSVLAPTVTRELHLSEVDYGWLASAFSIAYLLAAPLAGWWLDRIGARRGLMLSVLVWSLVAAGHSLALGFGSLFLLRILLGAAESPSYPGSALTMQRVLPPRDRARGYGVLFTGSSIGVMVAAPLASWLFAVRGWRFAFLGTAMVGLVWVPSWLLLTRRSDVHERLAARPASSALARRWHETLRAPAVLRAIVAVLAAAPLQVLPLLFGAKYLDRTFAVAQKDMGHYLWMPAVGFDVAAVLIGDLASRRRDHTTPPRLLFVVATLAAACIALLGYARTPLEGIVVLAIGYGGSGAMYTLLVTDLLAHTKPEHVARTISYLPATQSLAVIVASPLVGWTVKTYGGYAPSAVGLGLWAIPGALVWLLWRT